MNVGPLLSELVVFYKRVAGDPCIHDYLGKPAGAGGLGMNIIVRRHDGRLPHSPLNNGRKFLSKN